MGEKSLKNMMKKNEKMLTFCLTYAKKCGIMYV